MLLGPAQIKAPYLLHLPDHQFTFLRAESRYVRKRTDPQEIKIFWTAPIFAPSLLEMTKCFAKLLRIMGW